jgi:hypothetical protein
MFFLEMNGLKTVGSADDLNGKTAASINRTRAIQAGSLIPTGKCKRRP